jgi:hypothetical protein
MLKIVTDQSTLKCEWEELVKRLNISFHYIHLVFHWSLWCYRHHRDSLSQLFDNTLEFETQGSTVLVWPYNPFTNFVTKRKSPNLRCLLNNVKNGEHLSYLPHLNLPHCSSPTNSCLNLYSETETVSHPGSVFCIPRMFTQELFLQPYFQTLPLLSRLK